MYTYSYQCVSVFVENYHIVMFIPYRCPTSILYWLAVYIFRAILQVESNHPIQSMYRYIYWLWIVITPKHGDLHAQVIVTYNDTEGVQRGVAEDSVVLVRHVDVEGDDLLLWRRALTEGYSQVKLTQGRHGPALEAYQRYAQWGQTIPKDHHFVKCLRE